MVLNFEKYAQEGERFLSELDKNLGNQANRDRTARVLRSVLHAVRDMLSPEENVQFMAQMPMFLKAVYVDRWAIKPKRERIKHVEDFVELVKRRDGLSAPADFETDEDVENAVSTVFIVLHKYVSFGELEDVIAQMPKEVKDLLSPTGLII